MVHVDGVRTFYRRVAGDGPPAVFVHGNPTHSEDWLPFLARIEGPAIALDLPGWGFSERPGRPTASTTRSRASARFVGRFLDTLGIDEHALVVHDWGAVALIAAQRRPERLRRLVVINAVPLLPGYRWHWIARWFWRVPAARRARQRDRPPRPGLRLLSAPGDAATRRACPARFVDLVWRGRPSRHLAADAGALPLRRPGPLAAAGARLGELRCPALVVWGREDPYLAARFGRAYAERLPDAELLELDRAGHWPWIDRPEVVERVTRFLAG